MPSSLDSTLAQCMVKWNMVFLARYHRQRNCSPQQNITVCLKVSKEHLDTTTPQHYMESILWMDETKQHLFAI
uniref:Uncharacterized protein n=1 Tax=Mastacembelus armatus TaxID=205130 RepID=A0A3Q3KXP0_9TELE